MSKRKPVVYQPIEGIGAVLSLDLGSTMGWAKWRRGHPSPVTSGSEKLGKVGGSQAVRFIAFQRWLSDNARDVDLIVYEMPHHRGRAATGLLVGLEAHLASWCHAHDMRPPERIHSATIKKFVTGHGKAEKKDVIEAVKKAFPTVTPADDNEADALAALLTGIEKFTV